MPVAKAYLYKNCSTCQKAKKYLQAHQIAFEELPIREQPPSRDELASMLAAYDGDLKRLFNTSGQDYRAGGYKDRLKALSETDALAELAANGNLIKRPFVIGDGIHLVGFKEADWNQAFAVGAKT